VNLRDIFVENFAGDLEYHPRRAVLYFALAVAAFCFWIFSPSSVQFTTVPLVFALGGLALLIKGIFLIRKSSEGLGLSDQELAELSNPANRKRLPSIPAQASQIVQDFGTGSFLLWPLLNIGRDIDKSWSDPPLFRVFIIGAILFVVGWAMRRAFSTEKLTTPVSHNR
jgi:hypothetical protein